MPAAIEVRSRLELWICRGYSERVSSSTLSIYWFTPVESERMSAMPMMPMEPAKAVSRVRAFLLRRFWKLSESAVSRDIEECRAHFLCSGSFSPGGGVKGFVSERITPSLSRTMRVA